MTTKPSTTTQTRELEPRLPWRSDYFAIYDADNEHVAHTGGCGRSNEGRIATAQHIVKAVNAYGAPSTTEQVIRLREALEPHKAINFLTALEHQAHRNHEYHPDQCAECSLTQTIAERLRDELGLTTVRRTTTKG